MEKAFLECYISHMSYMTEDFLRETVFKNGFGESGAYLNDVDRFSPEFYEVSSPLLSPLSLSPLLILFILLSSPSRPCSLSHFLSTV